MGKKDNNNGGNDSRFASMLSAPMFKKTRHDQSKVKIDDRFGAVLSDNRFTSSGGSVDKYGRKNNKEKSNVSELSEFYTIDKSDEKDVDEFVGETKTESAKGQESRLDYLNKLARGEVSGDSESDDSDEDDESEESEDSASDSDADVTTKKGALDIPEDGEIVMDDNINTNRLAIQNCDWENLNSQDLM